MFKGSSTLLCFSSAIMHDRKLKLTNTIKYHSNYFTATCKIAVKIKRVVQKSSPQAFAHPTKSELISQQCQYLNPITDMYEKGGTEVLPETDKS